MGMSEYASDRAPDDYIKPITSGHMSTVYRDQYILNLQTNYNLPDGYVKTTDDGLSYIEVSTDEATGGIFYLNIINYRYLIVPQLQFLDPLM